MAPPARATLPSGHEVDLITLAESVCRAYDAEFPDERERYGPAGAKWCVHDNQHLLNWAILSLRFEIDFERQLAWLGRVLEARQFPLDRYARDLVLLADAVAQQLPDEPELHARVLAGVAFVRAHESFLR